MAYPLSPWEVAVLRRVDEKVLDVVNKRFIESMRKGERMRKGDEADAGIPMTDTKAVGNFFRSKAAAINKKLAKKQ
jgi:hypothetical protein